MPHLKLYLFGSFQLTINDRPVEHLRSVREAALLAYLAIESEYAHLRTHLAGLLWPDLPEASARNNLKQILLNLRDTIQDRQAQPPFLHIDRTTLQFNLASDQWVDLLTFSNALKATAQHSHQDLLTCRECQAHLVQAVALYRGPLLGNFTLANSDLYEEWLLLTREHYHNQAIVACGQLGAIYAHQGNYAEALVYVRRQMELDPFHEPAHRQLLTMLGASGDRSGALVQFDSFRVRLQNELGVAPSPETLALIEQIRKGSAPIAAPQATPEAAPEPSHASPIPAGVPVPSPAVAPTIQHDWGGTIANGLWIGRADEEAQLRYWLRSGVRTVTILGLAGVGKSALAQTLARSQSAEFAVIIWRALFNAPPLAALLADWLAILTGQPPHTFPQTPDLQLNLLFEQLRKQRVLLVLDNVESIMQGDRAGRFHPATEEYGQLFQRMVQDDHQSLLLLTSREQLQPLVHLEEETPAIRTLLLNGLSEDAGQQLLMAYGLPLATEEAVPIVQRFAGNPILLKFVAHSIQELFNGDAAAFLAAEWPIYGEIRDLFQQYEARLSAVEKTIIMWLAIAHGPIALATVQAAMRPPTSDSSFLEAIHALQRRALLEQSAAGVTIPEWMRANLIEQLLELITQEMSKATPHTLNTFRLLDEQAADEVRQAQFDLILVRLAERLRRYLGQASLSAQLQHLLQTARQNMLDTPGYLVENLTSLQTYVAPAGAVSTGLASPVNLETSRPAQDEQQSAATRAPVPPSFLPEQLTSFIGRERELAELAERLQQPNVRLLTLVGAGGMGKTSLVLAVGQAMLDAASTANQPIYRDGIFFVALASLTSTVALPSAIATVLGLSLAGGDPHQMLAHQVRHKRLLLILDNVEHLLHEDQRGEGGIDLIVTLLQAAPGLQIVATSRERLNLRGEHLYHLQPLAFAERSSLGEAATAPAVQLFVQSAQRSEVDFALTPENRPLILRICRLVQGIPLGLELAAANVGLLPLEEIASEIERSAEFLAVDWRDVPERQRSMRAVFDWSWQLLDATERQTLQQIAIFRGGFTREAAEQVAHARLPALLGLMRKSLLQRMEMDTGERFQIHELLRQFAEEHLRRAPQEKQGLQTQHATYYLQWLAAQKVDAVGSSAQTTLHAIETELGNINVAWRWAVEQRDATLLDAPLANLHQFYTIKGRAQEGVDGFEQAANMFGEQREAANNLTYWRIRVFQSSLLIELGDHTRARTGLEASIPILQRLGTPTEIAFGLSTQARLAYRTGHYHEAKQYCQEAIDLYTTLGDVGGLAINVNILGLVNNDLGEYDEARRLHQENLVRRRAHHDRYGTVFTLNNLGAVAVQRQDYAEAKRLYDEGLTLAQEINYRSGISLGLLNLGSLAYRRGEVAEALQLAQGAIRVTQEIHDHRNMAWALANLGNASYALGDYPAAARHLHEAARLALALRAVPRALAALTSIAALSAKTGNPARAVELASFVLAHPASQKEAQGDATKLLAELTQQLPPAVINSAQAQAQTHTLEQLVGALS